jgi:hypothetical protein
VRFTLVRTFIASFDASVLVVFRLQSLTSFGALFAVFPPFLSGSRFLQRLLGYCCTKFSVLGTYHSQRSIQPFFQPECLSRHRRALIPYYAGNAVFWTQESVVMWYKQEKEYIGGGTTAKCAVTCVTIYSRLIIMNRTQINIFLQLIKRRPVNYN